jgi:hypothetical protein
MVAGTEKNLVDCSTGNEPFTESYIVAQETLHATSSQRRLRPSKLRLYR